MGKFTLDVSRFGDLKLWVVSTTGDFNASCLISLFFLNGFSFKGFFYQL